MKRPPFVMIHTEKNGFTNHENTLRRALRKLILAADGVESAVAGVTDQFEPEVAKMSRAASAAEKVLKP